MKSNFFKKLAAGLALAMVVTSVAPTAATVSAATASITLKSGSKASTVYVTKSYALKLGKNVKATWRSSNKKVATVGFTGGVLKPVAPGKVTIAAKSKKTGKTYKKSYTVKLRAKKFTVSEDLVMAVGEKQQLKAVKTPANSTDVVRFFSDNKKVATVGMTGGALTAKEAGTATITAYCKATKASKNASKANLVAKFKVTVGTVITSAVQKTTKQLDVTFNTEMKNAKVSDFSIVKDETKQNFGVKKVTVDGKKVTVETFQDINDGKTYTVTCGSASYQFKATDGVVANLAISPATIPFGTATPITVTKVDANGVGLGEYKTTNTPSEIKFTVETTQGHTNSEGELTLGQIGNTAKATAIYHTYKYDANGNEIGGHKTELTITAVDKKAIVLKDTKFTIASKAPANWDSDVLNMKLAEKDDTKNLYLRMKNSDGKVLKTGYTLESGNKDVLLVGATFVEGDAIVAKLVAVNQGSAYVLVKNEKGDVVWSLQVAIVQARKTGGITLSTDTMLLSDAVENVKAVTCELKDQYGDKKEYSFSKANVECRTVKNSSVTASQVNLAKDAYFTVDGNKIIFKSKGVAVGVYTYAVEVDGIARMITVQISTPSTTAGAFYQVEVSNDKVDAKVNKDMEKTGKTITIKLAEIKGTVVSKHIELDAKDVIVKDKDGKVVNVTVSETDKTKATFSVVKVDDKNVVTKATAGNYTVAVNKAIENKNVTVNGAFTVVDTQEGLTCETLKEDVNVSLGDVKENAKTVAKAAFKLTYEGTDVTSEIVDADYTELNKTFNFKSLTANVKIGNYYVPITVKIAKTVTAK